MMLFTLYCPQCPGIRASGKLSKAQLFKNTQAFAITTAKPFNLSSNILYTVIALLYCFLSQAILPLWSYKHTHAPEYVTIQLRFSFYQCFIQKHTCLFGITMLLKLGLRWWVSSSRKHPVRRHCTIVLLPITGNEHDDIDPTHPSRSRSFQNLWLFNCVSVSSSLFY